MPQSAVKALKIIGWGGVVCIICAQAIAISASGNQAIDGLLSGLAWNTNQISISFPESRSAYDYAGEVDNNFGALSAAQRAAVESCLTQFSAVSNVSFSYLDASSAGNADIRIGLSDEARPTAYAYYPGVSEGGDIWITKSTTLFSNPSVGSYAYMALMHELGHALGLKHGHETSVLGALPSSINSTEYSIMTYASYVGSGTWGGYTLGASSFAQTLMMSDVAALQYLYGANFAYNSTNTVYSWNPQTGEMLINGVGQGAPAGNKVFSTIWDGGGHDRYDLSNYTGDLRIDLRPAAWSAFSIGQLADLGNGHAAAGNVANAQLFRGDTRSLIEDATGGAGNDLIIGNAADNILVGGVGNDTLVGSAGSDQFWGGAGADVLIVSPETYRLGIMDFQRNIDKIDLSAFNQFRSIRDVLAVTTDVGGGLEIQIAPGETVGIANVATAELGASSFLFNATRPNITLSANDLIVNRGALLNVASLVTVGGGANPFNLQWQLRDETAASNSGSFVVGGVKQNPLTTISIGISQLSDAAFQAGVSGSDRIGVRVSDGASWSNWADLIIKTQNNAPIATAPSISASKGQTFSAASLFSVLDADSDAITQYQFWDSTSTAQSGAFSVNGVVQSAARAIDVSASELAGTTFFANTGSNQLWVRASDGADWSKWTEFYVNAPTNRAPSVSSGNLSVAKGATLNMADIVRAIDRDAGDSIVAYQFLDRTNSPVSGHFVVEGVSQSPSQTINVTSAQFGTATFEAGLGGTDSLWVRATDGYTWSDWTNFSVTAINHAPITTAPSISAAKGQTFAAASLFSVLDADSDAITQYQFWDSTSTAQSGAFWVNGVVQSAARAIDVSASDLAGTTFFANTGSNQLWVRASDGVDWSKWTEFYVNAPVNRAPSVSCENLSVAKGATLNMADIVKAIDRDAGDSIVAYQFLDRTNSPVSGHFVVEGVSQSPNQTINVTSAQFGTATFEAGLGGTDSLWARATDGYTWSSWTNFSVTAINHAPITTAPSITATKGQIFAAASLFSVLDADSDAITQYQFWDSTSAVQSGAFTVNSVVQTAGKAIDVSASDLDTTTFFAGAGSNQLWVRASDGVDWGKWTAFNVVAPANQAPSVSAGSLSVTKGATLDMADVVRAADRDVGDSIVAYQFWDSTNNSNSGHFVVDGVVQTANRAIDVTSTQFSTATFVAGLVGSDSLWARATDGYVWSDWTNFSVEAVNRAPVAAPTNISAMRGQVIAAADLFSLSDADNDNIAKYQFWDSTSTAQSGAFSVNGVVQTAGHAIDVVAADLANTTFTVGGGADQLWVRAFDGAEWGKWTEFHA